MTYQKVNFRRLKDTTLEDQHIQEVYLEQYRSTVPDMVLDLFNKQRAADAEHCWHVDRYEHSLQTATRAYRDKADDELIVAALLHDIGDVISPANHSQVAAALLAPYIHEDYCWLVAHHGLFQGYYYYEHWGVDKHSREKHQHHKMYNRTVQFCEEWDQPSFGPGYESLPLAFFEPLIRSIFKAPRAGYMKGELRPLYLNALAS